MNDVVPVRRSPRYPGFNYASSGAYFVTAVTQGRVALFGDIIDDAMCLNDAGRAVEQAWHGLKLRFLSVRLDYHVTMPNHFHGIVWLDDPKLPDNPVGAGLAPPVPRDRADDGFSGGASVAGGASPAPTLSDVMSAFKSVSARQVNEILGRNGALWQRSFYERVIRDERELHDIRKYIIDNPARWADDKNFVHAEVVG